MNQTEFEAKYRQDWEHLDQWLAQRARTDQGWRWLVPGAAKVKKFQFDPEAALFPKRFRQLCQHVALARSRSYSLVLVDELNALAMRAHQRLYGQQSGPSIQGSLRFAIEAFPIALWQNRGYVLAATLVFLVPLLVMFLVCLQTETGVYSVMSHEEVSQYQGMYQQSLHAGAGREAASDVYMFGFYIYNNIGVAFRTFAGGLVFGVGALLFLAFNGISIGAVAGHLARVGLSEPFFSFVVGHGAFELTAIVFSGAAGFKLGDAFFKPGRYTRLEALRRGAIESAPLMYGVGLMLVVAAALEAFWSSSAALPVWVKYVVGALFWVLVIAYCCSGGWLMRATLAVSTGGSSARYHEKE